MPNVLESEQAVRIEFVDSMALDLVNCMYFTFLSGQLEGVDDWALRTREAMDPALRAELDLLYSYPRHEPGIMGALNDVLFFHREAWADVDALLSFVRSLPAAGTPRPEEPGIQGLALYSVRWPGGAPYSLPEGVSPRDALVSALLDPITDLPCIIPPAIEGGAEAVVQLFDDPEQVRARMLSLIRRFYDEHYRPDEGRRTACLRRSVKRHKREGYVDIDILLRRLTGRQISCIQEDPTAYRNFIFVPSLDVGAYNSCADVPPLHGLHFPCEVESRSPDAAAAPDDEATHRMALVYRALSDEQRLRILRVVGEEELYAQQIVERTGLHQSVVSRHLAFLRAVSLVNARRQNNMKFYTLNAAMGDELRRAVDVFLPPARIPTGR